MSPANISDTVSVSLVGKGAGVGVGVSVTADVTGASGVGVTGIVAVAEGSVADGFGVASVLTGAVGVMSVTPAVGDETGLSVTPVSGSKNTSPLRHPARKPVMQTKKIKKHRFR